jgi:two-component sensor histidine kinase
MISSVISMEGKNLSDDEGKGAFVRMRRRIEAIGTLYRTLSRTATVDSVKAGSYLSAIVRDAVSAMEISPEAIHLELSIDDIFLSTRIAVPLGLITNELVTNSLKYAYNGRDDGALGLRVVTDKDGIELMIWDDGPGIDENARVDSGLGQKLVEAFVQQLGGALSRTSGQDGTRYTLTIPHSEIFRLQGKTI